ncbi:hypothetical protein [Mycobacterium avium]|uniref:hypothetical protein n=1 Tax=Mycobacterium avium TaxID=1764 RepID=UPI0011559151|nr:hypothetical protein [Mycobacterium avium]
MSEYYTERDTRAPVVFIAGDQDFAKETMGVEHGGGIDQDDVTRWFSEGISPAGPGVGKPRAGTPGWDVLLTGLLHDQVTVSVTRPDWPVWS